MEDIPRGTWPGSAEVGTEYRGGLESLPGASSLSICVGPDQRGARGSLQPVPEPGVVPLGIPAISSEEARVGPTILRAEASAGEGLPPLAVPAAQSASLWDDEM
eukprot:250888-Heterocapsa_arctica.AAC.1